MASFAEYKQKVLDEYDRQLASGKLPSTWGNVTPGDLKSESIRICEERFDPKDEKMLRLFVGQKEDATAYRNAIQNRNADPFRPLALFLRDRSRNPQDRQIELLAWLINFEPRPWRFEYPYATTEEELKKVTSQKKEVKIIDPPTPNPESDEPVPQPSTIRRRLTLPIVLSIIVVSVVVIYLVIVQPPHADQKCMYWNDDHYQLADCNKKIDGVQLIAFDSLKVARFKKITKPDTLTAASIRKVWYIRLNGETEFYTDSGLHPLYPDRRLLPMSSGILEKYVFHLSH